MLSGPHRTWYNNSRLCHTKIKILKVCSDWVFLVGGPMLYLAQYTIKLAGVREPSTTTHLGRFDAEAIILRGFRPYSLQRGAGRIPASAGPLLSPIIVRAVRLLITGLVTYRYVHLVRTYQVYQGSGTTYEHVRLLPLILLQ